MNHGDCHSRVRLRKKGWTCQRITKGQRCSQFNKPGTRKCVACGKDRPARKQPAHMSALELDYEAYIVLNGGEFCGICGRKPSARRRLDRDHDHTGQGRPRGLLCARCNRALPAWITAAWLHAAAAYLTRVSQRLTETTKESIG
jgi:recombination endonuclease VII